MIQSSMTSTLQPTTHLQVRRKCASSPITQSCKIVLRLFFLLGLLNQVSSFRAAKPDQQSQYNSFLDKVNEAKYFEDIAGYLTQQPAKTKLATIAFLEELLRSDMMNTKDEAMKAEHYKGSDRGLLALEKRDTFLPGSSFGDVSSETFYKFADMLEDDKHNGKKQNGNNRHFVGKRRFLDAENSFEQVNPEKQRLPRRLVKRDDSRFLPSGALGNYASDMMHHAFVDIIEDDISSERAKSFVG